MRWARAIAGAIFGVVFAALPCLAEEDAEPTESKDSAESSDSMGILDYLPQATLSGSLSYTIAQTNSAQGDTTLNSVTTLSGTPSTYIYEPWLATVNGTLNVSMLGQNSVTAPRKTGSEEQGTATTSIGTQMASQSDLVTGSVQIGVLPQSDYPVDIFYSRFNSAVQTDGLGRDLTGQSVRVAAQQKIYDDLSVRSTIQSDSSIDGTGSAGEDSREMSMEVDKRFIENYLRVGVTHRDSIYSSADLGAATANVNDGTLRYRTHPFDSVVTDSMSTLRFSNTVDKNGIENGSVMQGVTTGAWRPESIEDLVVNGAFRSFQDQNHSERYLTDGKEDIADSQSRSAFGTLTTTYPVAQRTYLNVGLNSGLITRTRKTNKPVAESVDASSTSTNQADDEMTMSAGGNASINYTSLNTDWEGFNWIWNVGGGNSLSATTLGSQHSENVNATHSLSRMLDVPFLGPLNINASEGGGVSISNTESSLPINHSAGMSQSSRSGKTWDTWNTTVSDSRALGGDGSAYQIMNVQLTKGYDPDRFSSWSANVSYQAYRQTMPSLVQEVTVDRNGRPVETQVVESHDTMNGNITYRQKDLFGVDGLNFNSDIAFNPPSFIAQNRARDFDSAAVKQPDGFGNQRWSNRLDFMIGQMRTSVLVKINNAPEGMSEVMMFQISRRF